MINQTIAKANEIAAAIIDYASDYDVQLSANEASAYAWAIMDDYENESMGWIYNNVFPTIEF